MMELFQAHKASRVTFEVCAVVVLGVAATMGERSHAQQVPFSAVNPEGALVRALPIRGSVYMLEGAGSNITVSVGPDGVLLVNAGREEMVDEVMSAIDRIQAQARARGDLVVRWPDRGGAETRSRMPWHPNMNVLEAPPKPIRYIINTHYGIEHTGGNAGLAESGVTFTGGNVARALDDVREQAEVLAHENTLFHMLEEGAEGSRIPTLTYITEEFHFSAHFNGDAIRLIHVPNARTDGDTIVHFHRSDVISVGDIVSMESYPVIEVEKGGHINGMIDALNLILYWAMPEFRNEGGTMIVPGQGRLIDSTAVIYYRDMLTIIRDRVQRMIEDGMSLAQVLAARPTKGYDSRFGTDTGSWTTDMFVEAVYRSLNQDYREKSRATRLAR